MNGYLRPKVVDECVEALKKREEGWVLLAGGTDLIVHNRYLSKMVPGVIDLSGMEELRHIEERDDEIYVGAMVTMTEISKSPILKEHCTALTQAADKVGSTQIRNRATIGGNVANAAHCADTVPVLCAYQAMAILINANHEIKQIPVEELIIGSCKTVLVDDEMIMGFMIPKTEGISAFGKIGSRKAVTISKINGCVYLSTVGKQIKSSRIFMGSVGVTPSRCELIEKAIEHQNLDELEISVVRDASKNQIESLIPNRSSKKYKSSAVQAMMEDVIEDLRRCGENE